MLAHRDAATLTRTVRVMLHALRESHDDVDVLVSCMRRAAGLNAHCARAYACIRKHLAEYLLFREDATTFLAYHTL